MGLRVQPLVHARACARLAAHARLRTRRWGAPATPRTSRADPYSPAAPATPRPACGLRCRSRPRSRGCSRRGALSHMPGSRAADARADDVGSAAVRRCSRDVWHDLAAQAPRLSVQAKAETRTTQPSARARVSRQLHGRLNMALDRGFVLDPQGAVTAQLPTAVPPGSPPPAAPTTAPNG